MSDISCTISKDDEHNMDNKINENKFDINNKNIENNENDDSNINIENNIDSTENNENDILHNKKINENKHQSSTSKNVRAKNATTYRSLSPLFFSSSCSDCDLNIQFVQHYMKKNKQNLKYDRILRTAKRTIYTAGRPPWYNTQGQPKESFLIG